jgi:hypothetical protein
VSVKFMDPWLNFSVHAAGLARGELVNQDEPITPGLTASLIRAGISAGWQPEETGKPTRFTMAGARTSFHLVPLE